MPRARSLSFDERGADDDLGRQIAESRLLPSVHLLPHRLKLRCIRASGWHSLSAPRTGAPSAQPRRPPPNGGGSPRNERPLAGRLVAGMALKSCPSNRRLNGESRCQSSQVIHSLKPAIGPRSLCGLERAPKSIPPFRGSSDCNPTFEAGTPTALCSSASGKVSVNAESNSRRVVERNGEATGGRSGRIRLGRGAQEIV